MKIGYVDTSCLLALAFDEPQAKRVARLLQKYDRMFSANLLEAELRGAFVRERIEDDPAPLLDGIWWIHPDRPLSEEFGEILAAGDLRGADLWHLASALYLAPGREIDFLTLDAHQREVSVALGFGNPL